MYYINIVGQTVERYCTVEAVFFFSFFKSRMLLFCEGQVQGGSGTCLNYPSDNSL